MSNRKKFFSLIIATSLMVGSMQQIIVNAEDNSKNNLQNHGVCTHFAQGSMNDNDVAMMKAAGITLIRDEVYWHTVQPNHCDPNTYTFSSNYVSYVNEVLDNDIDIILCLSMRNWNPQISDGCTDTAAERAKYAQFCAETAKHFPRVTKFEIGNEPNLQGFWGATPNAEQYAQMLVEAGNAIKKVRPDAIVIGGAFSDYAGIETYEQTVYNYPGVYDAIDAMSIHPYYHYDKVTELNFEGRLRYHSNQINSIGALKDLYITELGWPTAVNPNGAANYGDEYAQVTDITPEKQAQEIIKSYALADYYNIEKLTTYDYKNDGTDSSNMEHNFGIVKNDGTKKVSYDAVKEFNRRFENAVYMGVLKSKNRSQSLPDTNIHVYNVNGTPVALAWYFPNGSTILNSTTYTFNHSVQIYDLYGNYKTSGKTITLKDEPIYIYGITVDEMYTAAVNEAKRNLSLISAVTDAVNTEVSAVISKISAYEKTAENAKSIFDDCMSIGDKLIEAYRNEQLSLTNEQLGNVLDKIALAGESVAKVYASAKGNMDVVAYPDADDVIQYAESFVEVENTEIASQAKALLKLSEKFSLYTKAIYDTEQMSLKNGMYDAYYNLSVRMAQWAMHLVCGDIYAVAEFDKKGNVKISGAVGKTDELIMLYVLKPSANGQVSKEGLDYITQIKSDRDSCFEIQYKSCCEPGTYTIVMTAEFWPEPKIINADYCGEIEIISKKVKNQSNVIVDTPNAGDKVRAEYELKNNSDIQLPITLILAEYDTLSGALIDVKVKSDTIDAGAEKELITDSVSVVSNAKINAFLWENIKSMKPIYGGHMQFPNE